MGHSGTGAVAEPRPSSLLGGKYQLGDCIGSGGMGVVYRAEQPMLARTVAIKFLRRELACDPTVADRFRIEAIAAARLVHPHSVAVLDYGEREDGTPFLVMEYVRGHALGQILRDERSLSVTRAAHLVGQILSALGAAHRVGIVHGDVKSDNVLVELVEGVEQVKLVDFGLARVTRAQPVREIAQSAGDVISGTPEYMAPEVIRGSAPTPAADLYGVGVILYELLTGATPFGGGSPGEVLLRQLEDPVVPPSLRRHDQAVPPALERVIARALEKAAGARFHGAGSFAAALAASVLHVHPDARADEPVPIAISCDESTAAWRGPDPHVAESRSVRRRAPRGSNLHHPVDVSRIRHAIGAAMIRGIPYDVAAGYLRLAERLVERGQTEVAVRELEEGVDVLLCGRGQDVGPTGPARRLLLVLSSLYESLGDPARATRAAAAAGERTVAQPLAHAGPDPSRRP